MLKRTTNKMKKTKNKLVNAWILLLLCSFVPISFSNEKQFNLASATQLPDPNDIPSMMAMTLLSDPSTSMGFNWNTTNYTDSDLQIVKESIGDFTSDDTLEFIGETSVSRVNGDGFIHSVKASGLEPNTDYIFRLGDKELDLWADTGSFTTSKTSNSKTHFIHVSDPQGDELEDYQAYNSTLSSALSNGDIDFIALTGDIVNNSWAGEQPIIEQWDWALTEQWNLLKDYPVMPISGNHDAADNDFISRFTLDTPNGAATKSGAYYSLDYNGIHFICLNTNDTQSESPGTGLSNDQFNWLIQDLENNKNAKWIIVTMHKGIFDAGGHCSNADGEDYDIAHLREQLAPVFTTYGVDLVLQGHDHLYSRTYPTVSSYLDGQYIYEIDANYKMVETIYDNDTCNVMTNVSGTIYLNSGSSSGSKFYEPVVYDDSIIHIEQAGNPSSRMYTDIIVDSDILLCQTYILNGDERSLYASFGIDKTIVEDVIPEPETTPTSNQWIIVTIVLCSVCIVVVAVVLFIIFGRKRKLNKKR